MSDLPDLPGLRRSSLHRLEKDFEAMLSGEPISHALASSVSRYKNDYPELYEAYHFGRCARILGDMVATPKSVELGSVVLSAATEKLETFLSTQVHRKGRCCDFKN